MVNSMGELFLCRSGKPSVQSGKRKENKGESKIIGRAGKSEAKKKMKMRRKQKKRTLNRGPSEIGILY